MGLSISTDSGGKIDVEKDEAKLKDLEASRDEGPRRRRVQDRHVVALIADVLNSHAAKADTSMKRCDLSTPTSCSIPPHRPHRSPSYE